MTTKLTLQKPLMALLGPVCLVIYIIQPYRGWMTLTLGFGMALILSYFWAQSLRRGLEFAHERRYSWVQVGDTIEERFSIRNRSWLPAVWIEIEYATTMPDYHPGRATTVPGEHEYSWTTRGACTRRGVFTLGPLTLRTGDPLGLFQVEFHSPATSTVLVEPPVIPLPDLTIAPGGRTGDSRVRGQSFERSISVSNVREYAPGDAIRMIHWPTTARKGDYYVRVLESRPAGNWWVFLDLDEHTRYGSGHQSTVEHGVILAASIVEKGIRAGSAVGLVTQTGGLAWHPPHVGEAHRHAVMRTLATASPGPASLRAILEQARTQFRQNPSLIIITANTSPDWLAGIFSSTQHAASPTVILLDPTGYAGGAAAGRSTQRMTAALADHGIAHTVLDAAFFDRPETRPGSRGRWKWADTRSSRAVPITRPDDAPWQTVRPGER